MYLHVYCVGTFLQLVNYHLSVDINWIFLPLHKLNFTATGIKPELTKKAGNGWLFKSNSLIRSVILSKECSKTFLAQLLTNKDVHII